jgi:CRP-like cAMP-binding protein
MVSRTHTTGAARRESSIATGNIGNLILSGLPREDLDRLLPQAQYADYAVGEVIYEPQQTVENLVLPTHGIISLVQALADGSTGEIGVVGREGAVGLGLVLASGSQPNRAVVQSAGGAYRIPAGIVEAELARGSGLQQRLLRYTQALMTQIQQTALCNRHHTIEQQLCRWLLLSLDRLGGSELSMTQNLISQMLGVRREGVTQAAGGLQQDGLIHYRRGEIDVVDRAGVRARCCECYDVVRDEYERLLGPLEPDRS